LKVITACTLAGFLLKEQMTEAELERQEYLSKAAAPYAATIVNRVIKDREPCVLVLPTGAGKSTVIPYAFVQAGYRVMIAEPTVAMCLNVVDSFNSMFPSIKVGRAFGRELDVPKDAKLVVTSNGALKKRLLGTVKTGGTCVSVEFTDILMLDEVHLGALDTHIIVSIWYYCSTKFATTARMPRLLLSSATVGDALFSRRFSPCVILPSEAMTPPFQINVNWSDKDFAIEDVARYAAMGALLKALHQTQPISERILVFLPGKQEMTKTLSASGLVPEVDITLATIWSESKEEDYVPIKRKHDDKRLVVFATPSADAGLTVIGLKHVIDSLLVKNSHVQPNGSEDLVTEVASKQLSRQRMGRVGRKDPGDYYPMCTKEFYNSPAMPASYTLEIHRRPLYNDIVELVAHGIQVEEVFAIYNIPSLPGTIEQLLNWGLLRRSASSNELFASSGGNFMTQTELAYPRLAGVLYAWVRIGKPVAEGVILTQLIAGVTSQILQIPNFDVRPGEPRGKVESMKREFIRKRYGRFQGPSDVHSAIRLWNAMISETATSGAPGKPGDFVTIQSWCQANAIQWRTVKNVLKSIQKTIPRILREAVRLAARDENVTAIEEATTWLINEPSVMPVLRRLMEHVYQDQIATRGPGDRVVYVARDGSTITPSRNSGFTAQSDPDSATPYPSRIVVIGQRTSFQKLSLTQFLDIDNHNTIAKISTDELNTKLGIFLSRGSGRRSTHA
jgi:HrpA-like RNA helicase